MNKKIIGSITVFCLLAAIAVFSGTGTAKAADTADGQFNCFDLYKFGSVEVNLTAPTLTTTGGTQFNAKAHIENHNAYPVVDGSVYVKIFRLQDSASARRNDGDNVVDQFYAAKNINLGAHASLDKAFTWKVPTYAMSGDYRIVSYFLSADKFNLMGLPFTDDVHGGPLDFKVSGVKGGITLDKNTVTVNGSPYSFVGIMKPVNSSKPVVIQATVINSSSEAVTIPVVARIYRWAQNEPDSHRSDLSQMVSLKAGEKKSITFMVTDQESLTLVAIEANYKDSKSILDVRFGRDGLSFPRINFPGLATYPLKAGQPATMFVCAHAAGVSSKAGAGEPFVLQGAKIVLTLSDESGTVLNTYTYNGPLTGDMMGFKSSFVPKASTGNLVLKAEAYQGSVKLDSAVVHYSCATLGSAECAAIAGSDEGSEGGIHGSTPIAWIILGLLGLLAIISICVHMIHKNRDSGSVRRTGMKVLIFAIAGLGAAGILGLSPGVAKADTATWSGSASPNWMHAWMRVAPISNCPGDFGSPGYVGPCFGVTVGSVSASVTYGAQAINPDTAGVISNGATLNPGDRIEFQPNPFNFGDISWNVLGGGYGTPPGYWNNVSSCDVNDYLNTLSGFDLYTPLKVNQPTPSVSVSGPVSGSGWGPYTVTGPGTVSATVTFPATSGAMYAQGKGGPLGLGCSTATFGGDVWNFTVSQQDIGFSFTSAAGNSAPSDPVISGPISVSVGASNTYSVVASDPEGDNLYYLIDYDSNHGSVDQVLPTVSSGTSENFSKAFAVPGSYTIYAQAVDVNGSASGWSSLGVTVTAIPSYTLTVQILGSGSGTITSSPAGISCSSGSCSTTFTSGTSVTLTGAPGAGSDFTAWGNDCSSASAPGTCTLTMSSDKYASATFDPTFVPQQTLGVTVVGNGSVTSSPAGINCPAVGCSDTFAQGSTVTLTATPSGSDTFNGWSGACSGTGSCVVSMTTDKAVTANFTYTISVTANGPAGSGTITGGSISCSAGSVGTCSAGVVAGGSIILTATPTAGNIFNGWSGPCSGTGTCNLTMNSAQAVTGTFAVAPVQCADGIDNDGDGLVDAADLGCGGGPGDNDERGGGPLNSAVCTPSSVTTLSSSGSVNFSASATALGTGSGTFEYSWDGGTTWGSTASKSVSYSIPGGAGPILRARDAVGPGAPLTASPNCGNVVVTGSITVTVGPSPSSATSPEIAVKQGGSFVVKWNRNLTPTYSCSASLTPSSGDPSWSAWSSADFSVSGITSTLSTTPATPIGQYSFAVTCSDSAAVPGPNYSGTAKVRVTTVTVNEI